MIVAAASPSSCSCETKPADSSAHANSSATKAVGRLGFVMIVPDHGSGVSFVVVSDRCVRTRQSSSTMVMAFQLFIGISSRFRFES